MSSWQVRHVSVPTYKEGSAGFPTNFCVFAAGCSADCAELDCEAGVRPFVGCFFEPAHPAEAKTTTSAHSETPLKFIAFSLSNLVELLSLGFEITAIAQ